MHGEAADKPRYSFNFRVALVKKRESEEKEGKEEKNGRGLIKRANVTPGEEAGGGVCVCVCVCVCVLFFN